MMATLGTFVAGQVLTAAELNAIGTATAFTPTWTNLTVGDATVTGNYWRINELVFWKVELIWGTTTSASGNVAIEYPVAGGLTYANAVGGSVYFEDASGGDFYGALYRFTSGRATVVALNVAGTYASPTAMTGTVPFTWTSTDRLLIEDWYTL
jgi:hypothetical protein